MPGTLTGMQDELAAAALIACRDAVVDYRAGLLDDRELRFALARAENANAAIDGLVRTALALRAFTDGDLSALHRAINRMANESPS